MKVIYLYIPLALTGTAMGANCRYDTYICADAIKDQTSVEDSAHSKGWGKGDTSKYLFYCESHNFGSNSLDFVRYCPNGCYRDDRDEGNDDYCIL
ncbi:Uu.00g024670.m01.CDS01, partial [Anthostomella pinea]